MKYSDIFILGSLALLGALYFPGNAYAKSADDYVCPPRDEMCKLVETSLAKHVGTPAPKPSVKPKARPSVPVTQPAAPAAASPLSERQARKEADAAMNVAFAFNAALRR